MLFELRDDRLGFVRGYREADADTAAIGRINRRVDANHLAVEVEGRAAGIAAVDRRVDLQEIVIRAFVDVAAARRDDPGRDGAAKPERVADRHYPVADLRRTAVAEADIRQRLIRVDLEDGEIGLGVAADHLGPILGFILQDHLDFFGVADHVIVGHDITPRINDEPGSEGNPLRLVAGDLREQMLLAVWRLLFEEPAHELAERGIRKVRERRHLGLFGHLVRVGLLGDRNVDNRRQHLFDERCKALLLDQRDRRGHRLGRRRRARGDGRGLRPYERRQREARAEAEAERRRPPAAPFAR